MKIAVLHEPLAQKDLKDWGAPEQMLDGNSHTQGVLLSASCIPLWVGSCRTICMNLRMCATSTA